MGLEERLFTSDISSRRDNTNPERSAGGSIPKAKGYGNNITYGRQDDVHTSEEMPTPLVLSAHHDNSPLQPTTSAVEQTSPSLPDEERPRKRRRPALSCEPCRRRKVRCDRVHPCGPCARMGVSQTCEYDNRFQSAVLVPSASDFTIPKQPTQRANHLASGLELHGPADSENELRRHGYTLSVPVASNREGLSGVGSATPHSDTFQATFEGLEHAIQDLRRRVDRSEHWNTAVNAQESPTAHSSLRDTVQALASRIHRLEEQATAPRPAPMSDFKDMGLSVPHPKLRMRHGFGVTKFWGPTHYVYLFDPKSDLFGRLMSSESKFTLENDSRAAAAIGLFHRTRLLRNEIKASRRTIPVNTIVQAARSLSKRDHAPLIDHYFSSLEGLFRILHRPSFEREYRKHCSAIDLASEVFIVQLLLVCSIGSVFLNDVNRNSVRVDVPSWIYAAQAWLTGPSEKAFQDESWIQCWCLLILARQANGVGTKEQSYILASSMVRAAFTLGLNRDPTHLPDLSPFRTQMRRRMWCTVLEISLLMSFDANMAPLVHSTDFDCGPPSDLDDDQFDENSSGFHANGLEDTCTSTSAQILLHRSFGARLEVARILNDFRSELSYEHALKLGEELQAAARETTDFFRRHPASRTRQLCHQLMQSLNLSTQLYLYRPFLHAARTDRRFHYARHMALETAAGLLGQPIDLNPKSSGVDEFSLLTLHGSGVFRASISLGAIGVVSQELVAQLSEQLPSPAARAARQPLIDLLFRTERHCLNLVTSGDPSCKRFVFTRVMLAMIRAKSDGYKDSAHIVSRTLCDAARTCLETLSAQLHSDGSSAPLNFDSGAPGSSDLDLSSLENIDFSFDPSWLLTAWDFGSAYTSH